jgi:lipocalin
MSDLVPFQAWISKYALTRGLYEVTVTQSVNDPTFDRVVGVQNEGYVDEGKNWHRTRGEAVLRAKDLRDARVASLRKQISKLEGMTFEVPK